MVELLHCENQKGYSILRIISDIFSSNTYIIEYENRNSVIVIDPAEEKTECLINWLKSNNKKVENCLITHEHFDHHAGLNKLLEMNKFILSCSKHTEAALKDDKLNLSYYYNKSFIIENQNIIKFNKIKIKEIETFETPGHSKGSLCFLFKNFLFSGDTIIDKNYLTTKLPGGNKKDMVESLNFLKINLKKHKKLIVMPGHGDAFYFKNWINENT